MTNNVPTDVQEAIKYCQIEVDRVGAEIISNGTVPVFSCKASMHHLIALIEAAQTASALSVPDDMVLVRKSLMLEPNFEDMGRQILDLAKDNKSLKAENERLKENTMQQISDFGQLQTALEENERLRAALHYTWKMLEFGHGTFENKIKSAKKIITEAQQNSTTSTVQSNSGGKG